MPTQPIPRRRRASLVLGLALALLAAACGDDDDGASDDDAAPQEEAAAVSPEWQAVLDAAEAEGSVTLYSFQAQENLDALKEAFEAAHPAITLNASRVVSSDGPGALEAERTTGSDGADVYMDPRMVWAKQQLALDDARIVAPEGPNVDAHHDLVREECRCVITGFTAVGIGWNTTLVPDPPQGLADIVDERYEGKIALPEIGPGNVTFYEQLREYGGDDYWERLAALDPVFYAGGAPVSQGVIAGEAAVTPFAGPAQFGVAARGGAPVEWAIPEDAPAWGPPFLAHVLGWAKHPNAAQVLIDFILSEAGQSALNADAITALDEPVEGTVGAIDDVAPYEGDLPVEETDALIAEWRETFGR